MWMYTHIHKLISRGDEVIKKYLVRHIFTAIFNFLPCLDHTPTPEGSWRGILITEKSRNNHLKLKAYNFVRINFSTKFLSTQ